MDEYLQKLQESGYFEKLQELIDSKPARTDKIVAAILTHAVIVGGVTSKYVRLMYEQFLEQLGGS